MKIFISGLPKSGKTTLIKNIYEKFRNDLKISGFYTEEILSNGKRIGFEIYSIDLNKKLLFATKKEKTNFQYAGYYLIIENLEKILDYIDFNADLILVDEIGKMETISKKFETFIKEILNRDINLIATVHREYLNLFREYGEFFWLKWETWNKTLEKIIKIIEDQKYK